MEVKKIDNEENAQWLLLCDYVKKDIMQYEDNQKLSKEMYLRLRGLKTGKMIDNNKIKSSAQYSFEIILYTFKICKSKIITATQPKTFKTEMLKFIYITTIVENNLNDVYKRITNAKKAQAKTETINTENISHDSAEYRSTKKDSKINKDLKKLW